MPTSVTRWDPMGELTSMRSLMDRLFESRGRFPGLRGGEELDGGALGLEVVENNDMLVVKAAVPASTRRTSKSPSTTTS